MKRIISHCFAKVNLNLSILGKYKNGYHHLQSVFLFLDDLYDILQIDISQEFNQYSASIVGVLNDCNSIKNAAKLLADVYRRPIPHVDIIKNIPMEAGLGGGSSDSACFVNSVFDIWEFDLDERIDFLRKYAPLLGADAVVFLHRYFFNHRFVCLDGSGIDGRISRVDGVFLEGLFCVVAKMPFGMSTKDVFFGFDDEFDVFDFYERVDMSFLMRSKNSLENSAKRLNSGIGLLIETIENSGAIIARMSGSGSSCFGIFSSKNIAEEAMNNVKKIGCDFVYLCQIKNF